MKVDITLCTLLILGAFGAAVAQSSPITVTEQTIKVGSNEEYFFGFAEGDEIVFDLDVVKGKNLKEVEIVEYPSSSKLFEFKTSSIKNKRIKVNKTAVYAFRLKGGGLASKICKMKIARIPSGPETKEFDTSVKWRTVYDSTYTTKYNLELVSVDTNIVQIADRMERVHSTTNANGNVSSFIVELPDNQKTELKNVELVSWAYWLGVEGEGDVAYEKARETLTGQAINIVAAGEPVTALALGLFNKMYEPPKGENIHFQFIKGTNGVIQSFRSGNSIVSQERITSPELLQGAFAVRLENDNIVTGLNVKFRVAGVQVIKTYRKVFYQALTVDETKYPVVSTEDVN